MTFTPPSSFSLMADDELFSEFSDFFKSVNGFRPRGAYWTRDAVIDWCDAQSTPEMIAYHQAQWEEEARRNDVLEARWDAAYVKTSSAKASEEDEIDKYELMAIRSGFWY
jgi:hypothetical protein